MDGDRVGEIGRVGKRMAIGLGNRSSMFQLQFLRFSQQRPYDHSMFNDGIPYLANTYPLTSGDALPSAKAAESAPWHELGKDSKAAFRRITNVPSCDSSIEKPSFEAWERCGL
jgi:hypothetical protein